MKPSITLFQKEFRQHGAFALAMVIMCLLFQIAAYESSRWFNQTVASEMYLFIALVVTALYAGAASALAYSTEHADNTYTFLRKLPISTTTLALGKIGWVLCGTVLVLLCNCLLAAVWSGGILDGNIAVAFGISILEMFVWGLFWSTRCRSQVHAMLAGFACASLSAWLLANMTAPFSNDPVFFYLNAVPYRLAFIAGMAPFALWGALRWFEFDANTENGMKSHFAPFAKPFAYFAVNPFFTAKGAKEEFHLFSFFRYPQKILSPFFALMHQHIRHASILYPLGIAAFVVFTLGCLYPCLLPSSWDREKYLSAAFYFPVGTALCMLMTILFWGNIFGHDQKNDSYRLLSRLGIHEGKVWWSRMLPALLFYLPVLFCILIALFVTEILLASRYDWRGIDVRYSNFTHQSSVAFTIWLAPVAMGAFFSLSFRSQMVAIALTIGGTLTLLGWMAIFFMLFGSSPLWTTVPIALALLIASRLRAKYWLRETYSWRSRLKPLMPFFVVMLAIPVALPMVRIYSIPYVSWEQIDSYFDQADLPAKRNPVKRKALLQYIAAHGTLPEEYEGMLEEIRRYRVYSDKPFPEGLTYEEFLLLDYADYRRWLDMVFAKQFPDDVDIKEEIKKDFTYYIIYMPWEQVRIERVLRAKIVSSLVTSSSGTPTPKALALRDFLEKHTYSTAFFDSPTRWWFEGETLHGHEWTWRPLRVAYRAIDKWYKEHGTLPESLDVLPEYRLNVMAHPFTDEPVRYYVNSPPPQDVNRYNLTIYTVGGTRNAPNNIQFWDGFKRHGGTYLVLGRRIYGLIEDKKDE